LIVDDDINVGACLRSQIPWNKIDCTVIDVAKNGYDGYALACEYQPDIIICDIVMPVMDGTSLCQKVFESMSGIDFIFLSAYEDFSIAQLALKYHVRDYILKPLDRRKLNYITQILIDIIDRRKNTSYYNRLLRDDSLVTQIDHALETADSQFFEELFQKLRDDIFSHNLESATIHSILHRLLDILFRHQRNKLNARTPLPEEQQFFDKLNSLRNKMDMVALASDYFFQSIASNSPCTPYYKTLCQQINHYISQHLSDSQLSSSNIADHFHYSCDYLGRIYSQIESKTLSAAILEQRMEYARKQLASTSQSINDIAHAVGYHNSSYFARLFRKYFGVNPTHYRSLNSMHRREIP